MQKSLRADYVFIAVYWLLFVGMSILFAGRNFPGAYRFVVMIISVFLMIITIKRLFIAYQRTINGLQIFLMEGC